MESQRKKDDEDDKVSSQYPLVMHTDMSEQLRSIATKIIVNACETHEQNSQLAAETIKKNLDRYSGKFWQVCVGESFAFQIEHDKRKIIYLLFGNVGIVAWKCS